MTADKGQIVKVELTRHFTTLPRRHKTEVDVLLMGAFQRKAKVCLADKFQV